MILKTTESRANKLIEASRSHGYTYQSSGFNNASGSSGYYYLKNPDKNRFLRIDWTGVKYQVEFARGRK